MNSVILIGRLTKDPELRYTPTNTAVATFTLAVDKGLSRDKKMELEQKNQPTADFINIVCWGKTAEIVTNYSGKGLQLAVNGRIQSRSYEDKTGQRRYVTEVVAQQIDIIDWKGSSSQNQGFNTNDNSSSYYGNDDDDFSGFEPISDNVPF